MIPNGLTALLCFLLLVVCQQVRGQDYDYDIHNDFLELGDGVRLAVTYYTPRASFPGETFPVLLEMLPYRKEDISRGWFHANYDYFAKRGLALARVDMRGTGGSEGQLPAREYSVTEINDAVELVALLAKLPWSNGSVGMWGISWGGFNAIQAAMRQPPALKAILAVHASDDLYFNDVHYPDGVFGIDDYILSINHMTGFMRSPDYAVNESYFENRFDREPWLFTYLRNSLNGEFWQAGSLRHNQDSLQVPAFFIHGLLDGYRDTAPRSVAGLDSPVQAVIGPWPHAWPHDASPGPRWGWRQEAVSFWKHWLEGTGSAETKPPLRFFLRDGHPPDTTLAEIPGRWYASDWPLPAGETEQLTLYPADNNVLSHSLAGRDRAIQTLVVDPARGEELGEWWGGLRPDMRGLDAFGLSYDSVVLDAPLAVVGIPAVSLRISADARKSNWVVRLEDVNPSGRVTLVTGGSANSLLAGDRPIMQSVRGGEHILVEVPLRFTTWTFKPGHRIRLSISNSAFPMHWPAAGLHVTSLRYNDPETSVRLPVWHAMQERQPIAMPAPEEDAELPVDLISYQPVEWITPRDEVVRDNRQGTVSIVRQSGLAYHFGDRFGDAANNTATDVAEMVLETARSVRHTTRAGDPAVTRYQGWMEYRLLREAHSQKELRYRTEIDLRSDDRDFHLRIIRSLAEGDREIRRRVWSETIPRGVH